MSEKIVPVILSGGGGTRLWPVSTPARPKQFLALSGDATMFAQTLARVTDVGRFAAPIVIANAAHEALVAEELSAAHQQDSGVILEPCARNTAPAIALAALTADDVKAPMLVMPSDHVIGDVDAFHAAIARALPLVAEGWLVTFGITPTGPETGYGYIRVGDAIAPGVHQVDRFVEKPELDAAKAMLAGGDHVWNGGIFLFRADIYLGALSAHAPDILASAQAAMLGAEREGSVIRPEEDAFAGSPPISIDYAVMEKADRVAVVPVSMGWSDVGSWDALHTLGDADAAGNVTSGDVRLEDGSGNFVRTDGIRVSMAGVDNLIVVANGKEILILPRGGSQEAKRFSN